MSFPTGWSYRCNLTIDADQVSGSANLTNFPVLLTEVNFPSTIFDNTQTTGADLRFTSDEAGTTELAFEIVNWDTTNDKAEVWVKIPTVDYDDDTTFYVWYGNATAEAYGRTATYGSDNVWTNYQGVWHLNGNWNDSSANQYDLTPTNNPPFDTAKISKGVDNEKDSSHYASISRANSPNLEISGSQVWDVWVKPESVYNYGHPICKYAGGTLKRIYSSTSDTCFQLGGAVYGATLSSGSWTKIKGIYDKELGKLKLFLNTTKNDANYSNSVNDTNSALWVGCQSGPSNHFDGLYDEIRIYNGSQTDGWAITEYANQNSPATFVVEGTEEDVGGTSVTITPDALTATSVINDVTISTVRNITTQLSEQTLTSSQPTPTVISDSNTTVTLEELTLTASQPACTVYPPTSTVSSVIFIANREKIAIKLSSNGKVYWELD